LIKDWVRYILFIRKTRQIIKQQEADVASNATSEIKEKQPQDLFSKPDNSM
jgi:hypothetical protein